MITCHKRMSERGGKKKALRLGRADWERGCVACDDELLPLARGRTGRAGRRGDAEDSDVPIWDGRSCDSGRRGSRWGVEAGRAALEEGS